VNRPYNIRNLIVRIEIIEEIIAEAAAGNLWSRIPVEIKLDDRLRNVESGINNVLAKLEDVADQRLKLSEELTRLKKRPI